MVLWGLLLQIISHFCFLRLNSTEKYYLSWSINDEFINLEGISSLTHRIYLLLRFFVKSVWFWVIFNVKLSIWEWRINLYFGNHWQIDFISNLFFEDLMFIWPIITFSEIFNLKFSNILFLLLVSLDVFVYRMLLVEIDSRFFAFDNLDYVGSIFRCVWVSKKLS